MQLEVNAGKPADGMVHDVSGLVKTFFRMLPETLLTYRLYRPLMEAATLPDEQSRINAIMLLMLELPTSHLHTTIYLMQVWVCG